MKDLFQKFLFRLDGHIPGSKVLQRFSEQFPEATNIDWSKEKEGVYEAIFRVNGIEMIAWFEKSGSWLKTETNYTLGMLADSIRTRMEEYGQIMSSIFIERASGDCSYEFIIRDDFQVRHVFMTDNLGNVLYRQNFDENELR
ncbi:MAG: hypothetical protein LWW85_03040 [Marinilabiliales bacterium]|nr:hypothetical protein [Marinilabiliales bacterium]